MANPTRRGFLGAVAAGAAAGAASRGAPAGQGREKPDGGAGLARPSRSQLLWQDLELGALFCLDLHTYVRSNSAFRGRGPWPPTPDRLPELKLFNPRKLDTDQWLAAAKAIVERVKGKA